MPDKNSIYQSIRSALHEVIDPETGADVLRMRLVEDLLVHDDGLVSYQFRPSSPLCPLAMTLVLEIIEAVKSVDGVTDQSVTVVDYIGAEELNKILKSLPLSKTDQPND